MSDTAPFWHEHLCLAAETDVGLRRANNQDALLVLPASSPEVWRQRGHLFLVADGMGAHAAGELASKIATDVVPLTYQKLLEMPPHEALVQAILDANHQIHARGQANFDFRGMGTTCTVLVLLPQGALVAHVGDSRVYRLRGEQFEQLTFDHSLLWELRRSGRIPEDALPSLISRNIITRSLGPNPSVSVDVEGYFPLEAGDTFLLCSDGLSGQVSDEELATVLCCLEPDEAVESLVKLANLRGGPDNITVIVVRVKGGPLEQPPPSSGTADVGRAASVHPLVWGWCGVSALVAVLLAVMEQYVPALVCLGSAAVAAIVALAQRYGGGVELPDPRGSPLGNAPYKTCRCEPAQIVERFAALANQLRDAAAAEQWPIAWDQFSQHLAQATAASTASDHATAVREYLRAVRAMLDHLKQQRQAFPLQPPAEEGNLFD
jgi:protein phosphatase